MNHQNTQLMKNGIKKMITDSESYRDINQRDFAAQVDENDEYMDDIIAGLYGKHG